MDFIEPATGPAWASRRQRAALHARAWKKSYYQKSTLGIEVYKFKHRVLLSKNLLRFSSLSDSLIHSFNVALRGKFFFFLEAKDNSLSQIEEGLRLNNGCTL